MFDLWKKGKTGFPLVDAGMRELWETGYMHNRVRMVVASFLVKNLSIDWKRGEDWFGIAYWMQIMLPILQVGSGLQVPVLMLLRISGFLILFCKTKI